MAFTLDSRFVGVDGGEVEVEWRGLGYVPSQDYPADHTENGFQQDPESQSQDLAALFPTGHQEMCPRHADENQLTTG